MNILYVTQWFASAGGGGEVVFHNLAVGMAKRGHKVSIISAKTIDLGEKGDETLIIHNIDPVLELPPPTLVQNLRYIVNAVRKGYHIIKGEGIEVIHANNLASVIAGCVLAKLTRKPLVITIHDVFSISSPQHWKHWVAQDRKISRVTSFIAPLIEKITVKAPSSVIHTVSETSKDDLIKFGAKANKICVITNGLDVEDHYRCPLDSISYQKFVLYIGRLVFYKNLDVVINSFAEVARNVQSSKLIIVGDGPMLKKWQKETSELGLTNSVKFTGRVSEVEKIELLRNCSALVLPSFVEGFGLVVLESFAMRKPVLAANVKPLSEIISDGVDGFLLPQDDPMQWSEKISYLLTNEARCMEMGSKGRMKLEEAYDINCTLDEMELLYLSLLAKSN